ncbi:MAG: hypothetical protein AAF726_12995 [Planctomycetota bacterium]
MKQVILDLEGNPLQGQTHGLVDKTVFHPFCFEGGRVTRFDVASPEPSDQ